MPLRKGIRLKKTSEVCSQRVLGLFTVEAVKRLDAFATENNISRCEVMRRAVDDYLADRAQTPTLDVPVSGPEP